MHTHIAVNKPNIIIPSNKGLDLLKVIRGDDYEFAKERDYNSHRGIRAFQLKYFDWRSKSYRVEHFGCEADIIGRWLDIIKEPDVYTDVLLFITQSLTTGPGSTQNFSVPVTWGPNTTSCIGGGGAGAVNAFGSSGSTNTVQSGGGGGGGAFASDNVSGIPLGQTTPYFIGSANQATWFKSSISLLAANGGTPTQPTFGACPGGTQGTASSSIGTTKRNGGIGGAGLAPTFTGGITSAQNRASGGGGGGGAAGTTADGTVGAVGTSTTANATVNGGNGGNSDTASGPAGGSGVGAGGNAGTDFDASHGAGSGGAGGGVLSGNRAENNGGAGGNYGAGGGGVACTFFLDSGPAQGTPGAGRQGMIFLSYVPYQYSEVYSN